MICTRPLGSNLLANAGFEDGPITSPHPVTNWIKGGGVDIQQANGTWFFSMPPRSGGWPKMRPGKKPIENGNECLL